PPGGTLQQAHAHLRLELADAPAQARFRDPQGALGGGEPAVLDHHREVIEVVEILHGLPRSFHQGNGSSYQIRLMAGLQRSTMCPVAARPHPPTQDTPMNLLHVDSSILGQESASRELSAAIVASRRAADPTLRVTYRDLAATPLPHLSAGSLAKADPAEAADAERVMQEFLEADIVVVGAPMYNFAIPSTLKAWIDRLAVAGSTFRYNQDGMAEGLAGGKQVVVASSRGGFHQSSGADFQEPYLRYMFGFMGITDIEFVRAEGLAISPKQRKQSLDDALARLGCPLSDAA